jgi:ABC-2 type transport system ATP-binding protein
MSSDPPKNPPAIKALNLTKRFGSLIAVDSLDLSVGRGEIFGIVGPDGAGKTTTLRMLASVMDPEQGQASIAGFDTKKAASSVKEHLAYMSQRFGLYPDLTVDENIRFYADLYGVKKRGREKRITELLGFSHMEPFRKRRAKDLSGGMKQKLQLICALIHTPDVLLLDEPTNGVDPVSRRDFWRILYKIVRQGVCILVTTAYLDEAERCDRIGLMNRGKLLATGRPDDIKKSMKGRILAVTSHEARKINKIIQAELPDMNTSVFGDKIHIVCKDIRATRARVVEILSAHKVSADDIRQTDFTLEDVFVSMMSGPSACGHDLKNAAPVLPRSSTNVFPAHNTETCESRTQNHAVKVKNLTRVFGSFTAVDNLSFKVSRGEIFGFLGPNGAGKSTTIRMLCGLLSPSSGSGTVAGFDINTNAEQIKQHIGYMSQKFSLYEDLSVEENIRFYGGIYGLGEKKLAEKKEWAMEMAELAGHGKDLTAILSAGWKQRLALACAILHEPPIIFLDEPTSGVDPLSRRRFWDMIYSMADQGITVFVTTHYMEEAEYCDRIALIYGGRMIAMGTPMELKTRHMHETILNITCPNPQNLVEELAALPQIRDAALFGAGIHVVTGNAAIAEKAIKARLASLGIMDFKMEKILPGMEDVFISLIEEDDRRQAAQKHEKEMAL